MAAMFALIQSCASNDYWKFYVWNLETNQYSIQNEMQKWKKCELCRADSHFKIENKIQPIQLIQCALRFQANSIFSIYRIGP